MLLLLRAFPLIIIRFCCDILIVYCWVWRLFARKNPPVPCDAVISLSLAAAPRPFVSPPVAAFWWAIIIVDDVFAVLLFSNVIVV